MVIAPSSVKTIVLPRRFDFDTSKNRIVHVSDLDDDGNLELWLATSFRVCENNDNDLKRDFDCSATSALMGEVSGETLSYFVESKPIDRQKMLARQAPGESWPQTATSHRRFDNKCNSARLAPLLEKSLAIHLGTDSSVVTLQCAPHPANTGQLVVAIFHELDDSAADTFMGFVVATVDMNREKLLRFHRGHVGKDASTRFDSSSLSVDPVQYELAHGVLAFGVRMHIGHSPKYAEGGESDYLTLLIEEKRRLRPVLEMLPMGYWYLGEETENCRHQDGDCPVFNVTRSLVVSSAPTSGLRSIDVIERHEQQTWDEAGQVYRKVSAPPVRAMTLHEKSGAYKRLRH
jgi:hypothetical protein